MSRYTCRFLRPYLCNELRPASNASYARFFSACRRLQNPSDPILADSHLTSKTTDYQKRVKKLESIDSLHSYYPRFKKRRTGNVTCVSEDRTAFRQFIKKHEQLAPGETARQHLVEFNGRVLSARRSSSRLIFVTMRSPDGDEMQGMCDFKMIDSEDTDASLDKFSKNVRKGDWISIAGYPHRTARGELSVLANSAPTILAPSLNQISDVVDQETLSRHRHVDLLLNKKSRDIILLRHALEAGLQEFLQQKDFTRVSTPILIAGAGGAVARPFKTTATELSKTKLDLRIAPELFLKRLLVGGLKAVYELGPAFRNEGVDLTHNPEFTICEFYKAFADLDELMELTQVLFLKLHRRASTMRDDGCAIEPPTVFPTEFRQIEFIPFVEAALRQDMKDSGYTFPDLSLPEAKEALLAIFRELGLPIPANASLPKLLDALGDRYIEQSCVDPTFVKHHPAIMSPLAKSFICPQTNQLVSARAELFIAGIEYANMYEEENSPFEQRRKFEDQLMVRGNDGEASAEVDESYIEALEWGLPPTGGWGCGVDRMVMLFAGTDRIADVLPFGTLRNVVGMAQNGRPVKTSKTE